MFEFSGKTALVTGGSRGIGRSISQAFASAGARVAINFLSDESTAKSTLQSLEGTGHILLQADISDSMESKKVVENAVEAFSRLDILVNSAGIGIQHPISDTSYDDWQEAWRNTLEVNLIGPANTCYCAAHQMMKQGGGRIVNISSRGAFRGEPNQPAYGASKAGLNALSQSLAIALAPFNIFVGVVAPGFVETDMSKDRLSGADGGSIKAQSPLGRIAYPEEVANAVLFLASDGAEFTTGTIIDVNGASYLRS